MPIYEFRCRSCGRLTSLLVRAIGAPYQARCSHCGGADLARLISPFAYHKSEATVLEERGGEPRTLADYRDPRQIGRWVERRFQEMGVALPQGAQEMIQAAREGELPGPVREL